MKYTTVLFDLDGTLLNTLDDLADSVNYSLEQFGYPTHPISSIRQFVGNGIRKLIERAIPGGLDNPDYEACYDCFVKYYAKHNRDKTDLYPGIIQLIRDLDSKNIKMAIVTNKLQSASEALLEDFFKPYINVVIGDVPERQNKPHPDGVNAALKALNVTDKSTVLYIGDSDVDAQTAINSGLDYLLCTWGFRDKDQLTGYKPLAFIDTPSEINNYVS